MIDATLLPFDLPSVERKKLTVDFDGGSQSSDAGLLLLRQVERKLGVCRRLADAMPDRRDRDRIRHAMFEMVIARVAAIAYGHSRLENASSKTEAARLAAALLDQFRTAVTPGKQENAEKSKLSFS